MASRLRKNWILFNFELSPLQHKLLKKTARKLSISSACLLRLAFDEFLERDNQKSKTEGTK